jgi:phosphotransferase system  glucose/maltose/N-acetylglucosamine-specific IIC component
MSNRPPAIGCLVLLAGAVTALFVWSHGAKPMLLGGFEGEGQDLSVLWVELPIMLFGVPAAAGAVWALTATALRHRTRPTRTLLPVAATLLALGVLAWACLAWLGHVSDVPTPTPGA